MICSRRFFIAAAAVGAVAHSSGVWAASLDRRPVRDDGLVAEFHFNPTARLEAAVILLNGSDGGLPSTRDSQDLAASGFPTLSLAYFRNWQGQPEGVPDSLNEIPLEYLFRAIDWMKRQPQVDPERIVLVGLSRGAELALLVASMRPDIAGVAAFSPSSVVWQGVPAAGFAGAAPRPAWTLSGEAVPFQVDSPDQTLSVRARFENAVANPAARIPVERIRGSVLLVASSADMIWPSEIYAAEIMARLSTRSSSSRAEVLKFDDASHLLMGTGPGITRFEIPGTPVSVDFGGTPEGTAAAKAHAWARLKRFLTPPETAARTVP